MLLFLCCSGAGGLHDIKVKLEPNNEDSPSDTSTFSGSITDHRLSHSKVKSASLRKARRMHHVTPTRKKPDVSSRKISSSESTDELEDLEAPVQSHRVKEKCLPVRHDSPSKVSRQHVSSKYAQRKSPSRVFRQDSPSSVPYKPKIPLFTDDDTTDDMDEGAKPIVIKSESEDDDNVFETINKPKLQSSKLSSKPSAIPTVQQFPDDDATDDMDEDTKQIVIKSESEDDNVFETVKLQSSKLPSKSSATPTVQHQSQEPCGQKVQQSSPADTTPTKKVFKLSLKRHRSSPKNNPMEVLANNSSLSGQILPQKSSVDTTPVKRASLKKSPRILSTETPLSSIEEAPLLMSNTTVQPHTGTSHQKQYPSVETIDNDLSANELKEFERFSDTETDDDKMSVLKQKGQMGKSCLTSTDTDIESGSESRGCYQYSRKKEKSVKKVHEWLDSSSERSMHVEDVVDQPDSQTNETIMQCDPTSSIEQLSSHAPTAEGICDTSDQRSKLSEPVSSSQELRDINAEQSKNAEDTSQLDRDKYTPESPSSTSSSLPPVVWKQDVHPASALTLTKPERSLEDRNLTRASCNQLQSALISTSNVTSSVENQRQSSSNKVYCRKNTTSAIDIKCLTGHSDDSLQGERDIIPGDEIGNYQLDMQDTSDEVQMVKNTHEQGITAVSKEIVPDTKEDSEPESISVGSPMEIEVDPSREIPVSVDDRTFEQAVNKSDSEASHELTKCRSYSSKIHRLSDDLVKESNSSMTNEQLPTSMPLVRQATKHLAEERKPSGKRMPERTIFTEVPGLTYSNQKAILERKHLPDPSTSIQRPPARAQSSGACLLKQSSVSRTKQLPVTLTESLPKHQSKMQSSDASVTIQNSLCQSSACKESGYLPALSASSVRLPSLTTTGKVPEYKGTSSHLSKKIRLGATSTNTSGPSALSVSTQNLLDSIGQQLSVASVSSESKDKHPPSFIPAKKHVSLRPKVLPKVDDLSREILSWDPAGFLYPQQTEDGNLVEPIIQLKEDLLKVPSVEPFESFDHYLSTFKPLIFLELWNTVSL